MKTTKSPSEEERQKKRDYMREYYQRHKLKFPGKWLARVKRYRLDNQESVAAKDAEKHARRRLTLQPKLKAAVEAWSRFFDSLPDDNARVVAAHLLFALADFDPMIRRVIYYPGFDYAYIAPYVEAV